MKKIVLSFIAAVFSITAFSQTIQQQGCGTPAMSEAQIQKIAQTVAHFQETQAKAKGTAGVDSIPLSIHIVGRDNGTGYYELQKLFPLICNLNTHYAPVGFYFYIVWPIHYINNTNYYDHDFTAGYQMMTSGNIANTVNVYFVDDPAGNCGYFSPGADGVAIGKSCAAINSTTLTHELGHFFSLPHTFNGWEGGITPSNPEYVRRGAGANCSTAGDGFCDTDADYIPQRWNCPYTGVPLTDPLGDTLHPDGTIYMSYSDDACMTRFSAQQITAMQANLAGPRSNLLNYSFPPYSDMSTPVVTFPTNNVFYSNQKTLQWNAVPGAQYYYVKITTQSLPTVVREEALTTNTSFTITSTLYENIPFQASITPLNGKNVCGTKTLIYPFTYSNTLGINDIAASNIAMDIIPNPANDYVSLTIQDLQKGNYTIEVVSVTGQVIKKQVFNHKGGDDMVKVTTGDIANGLYTIKVTGGQYKGIKKLVVQH